MLHEFAGNADTYLNLNSISNSYSQDIGGTWYEAGLGFNFKTTDNSYVYADVVKHLAMILKLLGSGMWVLAGVSKQY